jgi:hypothetical protein
MWRTFLCCVGRAFQVLLIISFYISNAQATLIDIRRDNINMALPLHFEILTPTTYSILS